LSGESRERHTHDEAVRSLARDWRFSESLAEVRMRTVVVVLFLGVVAGAFATRSDSGQSASERLVLREEFARRVDAYVALHRQVEQLLPPEIVTPDLDVLFAPRRAMNREMRMARREARQGDIFTPALEGYFRRLIAETLQRERVVDLLAIVEDENAVHTPARVNGDYPAGRSVPAIPPCLLEALPPLPREVRYSFVGPDLILWDLHAGLIVDYVRQAVPVLTAD
jgi:hypothetical protein